MNKAQLRSWFNIDGSVNVQMPNEIFNDFSEADFKSFNHKCFAYAYYYLTSYLYRNTIYGIGDVSAYSQQNIISMFVANNTMVSYITKKNGVLDTIGYTKTTNNFPTNIYVSNSILEFACINDLKKSMPDLQIKHSPRFFIKEPVKALVRFDGEDFTGTFYSFQNTHRINKETFVKIITDEQLGHVGLYIYGFLSMMNDRFPTGYQVSNAKLAEIVGCTDRTVAKYTRRLEHTDISLIQSDRKVLGGKQLEKVYRVLRQP